MRGQHPTTGRGERVESPPPRFTAPTADPAAPTADPPGGTAANAATDETLYTPFRDWLEAKPGRHVLLAALLMIALQAAVRGYVKLGGWFMYDDFSFIGRAARLPLWSAEYLLVGWNGHVMPGAFLLVRGLTELSPVDYRLVAATDLTLQVVAGLLVYRLLSATFGRRPAILVPLGVYLFSVMTLPAFLWWAAALNQVPGQIAMAAVLLCHVTYHRTGATRYGVLGAVAALAGLMFSEKVLLVIPCAGLLTLLWFTGGPPLRRLGRALHGHRAVWAAYAVVAIPYLTFYAMRVETPLTGLARSTIVLQTAGTALTQAVLPALFGGPFRWMRLGVGGIADPPDGVVIASAVTAGLIVALSVVRMRRASFAWFVVAGYWLANALLLGITRASIVGPLIGREYRYSTDVCLVVAFFGTLAFLSPEGRFAKGEVQRLVPRVGPGRTSVRLGQVGTGHTHQAAPEPSAERLVSTLLCIAFITAALGSTLRFDTVWRNEASQRYFATLRADLARAGRPLTIADLPFPSEALPQPLGLAVSTGTFLPALRPHPRILHEGGSTEDLFTIDATGHVRAAYIDGFANLPGPVSECGYRVGSRPVTVPLAGTTFPWGWGVRIGYLATQDADATVTAGSISTPVHVSEGLHQLFVMGAGAMGEVRISALSAGTLCTNDVRVGAIKPLPGTHP
jgi:hypothetical protein